MQLRDSINKTKTFFRRSLTTFKRFLHSPGYQKLPKPPSFHPFLSCGRGRGRNFHEIDEIFSHHEWQLKKKEPHRGGNQEEEEEEEEEGDGKQQQQPETEQPSGSSAVSKEVTFFSFSGEEEKVKKKTKIGVSGSGSRKGDGLGLARKIKEMEMVDVGDVDHVLDVEEALHYYSRLTSPVYVGIVDRFFTDMYTNFSDAPPQQRVSGSVLRHGSGRVGRSHRGNCRW